MSSKQLIYTSPKSKDRQDTVTHFLHRIFLGFRHGFSHRNALENRLPLSTIKQSLEILLNDCERTSVERVVHKINLARTPSELWYLRCEMHQCISHAHSQTEASRRINSLMTVFTGWIAPQKLTEI
jgi:hypothetical protein